MALSFTGNDGESLLFPGSVKTPGLTKTLYLIGAGLREGERNGKFMKFSAVAIYLEDNAVPWLAAKWKGKTAEELEASEEFLKDLINGPFEKFIYVKVLSPLSGKVWSERQIEICEALWKPLGIYTEAEAKALAKYHDAMKVETFASGSSVCTELSPDGTLTFSFGKDGSIPEAANVLVQNKLLSEEVLTVNIGYGGKCHVPNLRKSIVASLAELMNNKIHVSGVDVENASFPPLVKPPGTKKNLFLAGAGVRDGHREGKYMKFSAVSLYLEDDALPWLAAKWKGKDAEELEKSGEFVNDLITGPFEKLVYVKALETIFGKVWSGRQAEICRNLWKSLGVYTAAEDEALDKFFEVMHVETFHPGYSVFQTLSANGTLTLSFAKDGSVPKAPNAVIENKLLTENIVDVNIGKNGVTPATRKNIVARLAELINKKV